MVENSQKQKIVEKHKNSPTAPLSTYNVPAMDRKINNKNKIKSWWPAPYKDVKRISCGGERNTSPWTCFQPVVFRQQKKK